MSSRGTVELDVQGVSAGELGAVLLLLEHHFPEARCNHADKTGIITVELGGVLVVDRCWHPPSGGEELVEPSSAKPETPVPAEADDKRHSSRQRRHHTDEAKRRAVQLVDRIGIGPASRELDIVPSVLRSWMAKTRDVIQVSPVAERLRREAAVINGRAAEFAAKPAVKAGYVDPGTHSAHPIDHDAARRAAYPKDDGS